MAFKRLPEMTAARRHVWWTMFLAVFSLCRPTQSAESDDLVQALSAAIDTWQQQVEFYCTYELSETTAATLEDGRLGRFESPPHRIATGVYAKQGDLIRLSLNYGKPPKKIGQNEVTDVSVEEVRSRELAIPYYPYHDGVAKHDYLEVLPFPKDFPRASPVGKHTSHVLNPLIIFSGGHRPNLIAYHQSLREGGEDITIDAFPGDAGRVDLQIIQRAPDWSNNLKFQFWMKPSIPVVTAVIGESKLAGGITTHAGIVLEDFVEAKGGMVARTLRTYTPFKPGGQRCQVKVWHSDDLGKRPAKHADFVIKVREGTRIHCLKPEAVPKVVDGVQSFDITEFTLHDILPDCLGNQTVPPPSEGHWLLRLLGFLVLVGLIVSYAVYWRRKRQR